MCTLSLDYTRTDTAIGGGVGGKKRLDITDLNLIFKVSAKVCTVTWP